METMETSTIYFLAGGLTTCYLVATVFFFRFWHRTGDRLFITFAIAFALLTIEQVALLVFGIQDERSNYLYVLRIIAFLVILYAIIEKNVLVDRKPKP
jgi:hypothetical protein